MNAQQWQRSSSNDSIAEINLPSSKTDNHLITKTIEFIAEFLTPRELFNVAFSSKDILDSISQTIIVKNCLCNGNTHTKISVEHLCDAVSQGSVYNPNKSRLMRLINCRRCEFCNESKINFVRVSFGVCICITCLQSLRYTDDVLTKLPSQRSRHIELNDLVAMPRVATHFQSWLVTHAPRGRGTGNTVVRSMYPARERHFVWKSTTYDAAGNRIGPIVTKPDLMKMLTMKSTGEVDNYITNKINSPEICNPSADDFIDSVRKYRIEAFQRANALRERKVAATVAFRMKRLRNVRAMIRKLKSEAPETLMPLLEYFHHPRYLKFDKRNIHYPNEKYCVKFSNIHVQAYMLRYITTPVSVLNCKSKREQIIEGLTWLEREIISVGYDGPPPMNPELLQIL